MLSFSGGMFVLFLFRFRFFVFLKAATLCSIVPRYAAFRRNPVSKHQIQPEYGNERADAGRDCRKIQQHINLNLNTVVRYLSLPFSPKFRYIYILSVVLQHIVPLKYAGSRQ